MTDSSQKSASFSDRLKAIPQYLLPHHALSAVMYALTRCKFRPWKNLFIKQIVKHYKVDMRAAVKEDPLHYESFNAFFTRELKPSARPMPQAPKAIASPVDGAVSQIGDIVDGRIFQAKGQSFTVGELLGGDDELSKTFQGGRFATIYLSPRDYHRIHCPIEGHLRSMIHVPGRLFSVNPATTRAVPRLFARNERVAAIFDTEVGPVAVIMVGAIFVSSIETVWAGEVTPPAGKKIRTWHYHHASEKTHFARGAEIARFNMGSTVILLFGKDKIQWQETINAETPVVMGQAIGSILS